MLQIVYMHACDMFMCCVIYSNFSSFVSSMSQFSVHAVCIEKCRCTSRIELALSYLFQAFLLLFIWFKHIWQNCPVTGKQPGSSNTGTLPYHVTSQRHCHMMRLKLINWISKFYCFFFRMIILFAKLYYMS